MAIVKRREVRKRGFFGWLFLIVFLLFNLLMLFMVVASMTGMADMPEPSSEAEAAGRALGAGLAGGFLIFIWAAGAVITGLLALLTRGSKTIVEEVNS